MITADNLTKRFDNFTAVDQVSFQVNSGEVMVLLGANGAGKTTTVRMLTSILRPTTGTATIMGYDVVREPAKVRALVGVLTEQHGLYNRMNGQEYLEFFGRMYGLNGNTARRQIEELLTKFGLIEAKLKRLGEYSKGMRQKLALVRAMLHQPPVLLMDEPTSAMDPESARMVRDAILTLRSNERTIVLCTHNLPEAEELADKVAIIRKGRIILNDDLDNLKRSMLGPLEYEARFTKHIDHDVVFELPGGVVLSGIGCDWLRFKIEDPTISNLPLIKSILKQKLPLMSFQIVPQTLEEAYLVANNQIAIREGKDV
jgi:ABC-2 type transport system ATP-binding protein